MTTMRILFIAFVSVTGTIAVAKAGAAWRRGEVDARYFWRIATSVAFAFIVVLLV